MGILAEAAFAVQSTYHRTFKKSTGQFVLDQYMILPINNIVNWVHIWQRKQTQIEKKLFKKTPHESIAILTLEIKF